MVFLFMDVCMGHQYSCISFHIAKHCNSDCAIHMRTESGLPDPAWEVDFDLDPITRLCNIGFCKSIRWQKGLHIR